ncbi:MAG: hypothetical protein IIB03_06075 [Acidobacteria bacterium]|nr:hypothetical protein [Acidobacteriota bacterium]
MREDDPYNYEGYDPGEREEKDFARFQEILRVGQEAPDFEVTRLEEGASMAADGYARATGTHLISGSLHVADGMERVAKIDPDPADLSENSLEFCARHRER